MAKSNKRFYNFMSNSLSKGLFIRSLFQMFLFQSKKNRKRFIKLLSSFFQVKNEQIFLFGAGRMAVYSVLKSLELSKDDEVIVAGYTCVVLTNAVKFANCKIKYVDISKERLNIDKNQLLNSISKETRVLIIPHNFGFIAEGIEEVRKSHPNVIIIEDAAHTFGSRNSAGKLCGTLGDCSFFSMEYSKPISTGLGGVLIVNNEKLLENIQKEYNSMAVLPRKAALQMICTLGVLNLSFFKNSSFFYTNGFRFLRLFKLNYQTSENEIKGISPKNYPVKLNPLQCNLGYNQLKVIEEINLRKKVVQQQLNDFFSVFQDVVQFDIENTILARYPLVFKDNVTLKTIIKIRKDAAEKGFLFGEWFNDVVHPKGSYRYGYQEGTCPNGEYTAKRILNLPINASYSCSQQELDMLKQLLILNGIK